MSDCTLSMYMPGLLAPGSPRKPAPELKAVPEQFEHPFTLAVLAAVEAPPPLRGRRPATRRDVVQMFKAHLAMPHGEDMDSPIVRDGCVAARMHGYSMQQEAGKHKPAGAKRDHWALALTRSSADWAYL